MDHSKQIDEKVLNMQDEYIERYWKYYLVLEKDFINTERYLTISRDNSNGYSDEFIKLLNAICSEVDVVFKYLCKLYVSNSPNKIFDYCKVSKNNFNEINKMKIYLKNKRGENIVPWENFDIVMKNQKEESNSPDWWKVYQCVKHNRTEIKMHNKESYKLANQKNVLFSLAGLYCLEVLVQKKICENGQKLYKDAQILCDDLAHNILLYCESALFDLY